jgi:hypothetical protein
MESSYFLSAFQPTTSTAAWVFPEYVQGLSYLEPSPSTDPRLHDATNLVDLKLPSNALQVLAQSQASGRMPALFKGPAGQSVRTAKTFAATKRTAARSHSQAYMWKGGSASAYASGVSVAQPVSQLTEVSQFQPPPVKARVRRASSQVHSERYHVHCFVSARDHSAVPWRWRAECIATNIQSSERSTDSSTSS